MDEAMTRLRQRFVERTREELEILRRPADDPATTAAVIHRLSGGAGVFGFPEVSRLAAVLDDQVQAGGPPDPGDLAALVAELEAVASRSG